MELHSTNIEEVVRNVNRSRLSRTTPISLSHLSRIFGGTRMPGTAKLRILADELGVSMDALYAWLTAHRAPSKKSKRKSRTQ